MSKNKITLPNFIGVGSQRAGTTWLYNCLKEHPEIYLSEKKELHFFDLNFNLGVNWYLNNFANEQAKNATACGEITPNYYQFPMALERISAFNSDIKIIYIVRNPIDRAYSHYQLFSNDDFKGESFSEIIRTNSTIIDLGLQAKHLQKMQSLFKNNNILTLSYDELCNKPEKFLFTVFQFLNVDPQFIPPSLKTRINRVVLPGLQNLLIKMKLSPLITIVKQSFVSEIVKNIAKPKNINYINPKDREYLQSKFSSDICRLEVMLGIDLEHWKA